MEEDKKQINTVQIYQSMLLKQVFSEQSLNYLSKQLEGIKDSTNQLNQLDFQKICKTVSIQLNQNQQKIADNYIQVKHQVKNLSGEITIADGIMQQLQKTLYSFKESLIGTKSQMANLQQQAARLGQSLINKKKVRQLLQSFIQSAFLEENFKEAINSSPIDDEYIKHVQLLLRKINYLNNNLITPDSKALKELQPQLQKLKTRTSVRLREFLIENIVLLKKQKSNLQRYQKDVLTKYSVFTLFFKEQNPQIYAQLCNIYREAMAKVYSNYYKIILGEVEKIHIDLYSKSDQLIPSQSQNLRQNLSQLKHLPSLKQQRTIFDLMNRDQAMDRTNFQAIREQIKNSNGQRFTFQQTYKYINKALIEEAVHEIIITAQFFNLKSQGAIEIFGPLFQPSFQLFIEFIKKGAAHSYDIFAVFLILAINEQSKRTMISLGCNALQSYFSQIDIILWPRFQHLFENHLKSLLNCTLQHYKKIEKHSQKALINRFVDLILGLYRIYGRFAGSSLMLEKRLQNLKKSFFQLLQKVGGQSGREIQVATFCLEALENIHQAILTDSIAQSMNVVHKYQQELERDISESCEKLVNIYLKEYFPGLFSFATKYCKTNQDGSISIQGTLQKHVIELAVKQISQQTVIGKFGETLRSLQKVYGGFSFKILVKKLANNFTRYYNQIYKQIKASDSQHFINLLPTHNLIRQLKSSYEKYSLW